jgi:para-aminobenzoate synthetase/4-amino-4-deoxychorismate lyase
MDFSLLETMRLQDGTVVRLERHLSRLARSARRFGYSYDEPRVRAAVAAVARERASGQWRLRLLVASDGTPTIEWTPYVRDPRPWRVTFATSPVNSRDPFLANKTTNRVIYDTARRAHPEMDDVILSNERGEITESTLANIVVDIDGVRYTPPLECGLLGGTFRSELIESGEIRERVLTRADVAASPRLWLINSVREWIEAMLM